MGKIPELKTAQKDDFILDMSPGTFDTRVIDIRLVILFRTTKFTQRFTMTRRAQCISRQTKPVVI